MNKQEVIGVDLGGTAIKFGRFLVDGTCIESVSISTPQPSTPSAVINAIADKVNELNSNQQSFALGIGTPGATDVKGKIAKVAINLDGWHNVPIADELEKHTGLKTTVANDANCAGVGEAWIGAGHKYQNVIVITLGTGVGGAIILNQKLFTGHLGAAGELGLITLNPQGPPCNSGNNGSLEQYTSATAILRDTNKTAEEWGALAEENDSVALQFWQDYGALLGAGLTSLIYVLTPEAIIIGGGVSQSAKFFLPAVEAEINKRVLPTSREGLKILTAKLGNQAGITGAAKLAWDSIINES